MMKKNPAFTSTASKTPISLAAPVPKVPLAPASLPSKVVYNSTPSPAVISSGPTPASSSSKAGTPAISDDLVRKVAEAKRRVADAQSKLAIKDNPYMVCLFILSAQCKFLFKRLAQTLAQSSKKKGSGAGTPVVEQTQQGAGLKMTAHPLLLDQTPVFAQTKKERYKPMQPKFASIKANTRNQPTPTPTPMPVPTPSPAVGANPYTASSANAGPSFEGAPRERSGRKFHFIPKGKYVALGNQMRQENQLEELKQRIAESARKAGLDGDMGIEKTIKVILLFFLLWLSRYLIKSSPACTTSRIGVVG